MREGINIPMVFFLAVVGCLMVAITAFMVEGVYNFTVMEFEAKRLEAATFDKLNPVAYENDQAQLAHLHDDGANIGQAMAAVVADPQAVTNPSTYKAPPAP
ncbi:MAG: hypothetical protein AAGK09_12290 [Planctomycetota bacterium]